jgi:hypothetical protein
MRVWRVVHVGFDQPRIARTCTNHSG